MKIIPYGKEKYARPCVLLLGYFDAMHVGHRRLVERAKEAAAESGCDVGIMTFTGAKNGGQVFIYEERLHIFASLGIDFVYPADFGDPAFRTTEGDEFLHNVCAQLNVRAFVCGEDFTYGKGAACGAGELRAFGKARGIAVYAEPLVCPGGEKAASAVAKTLLDAGDIPALEKLLGGRYFIEGAVSTEGRHVGTKIGFPTANIAYDPALQVPAEGVYGGIALVGDAAWPAAVNVGVPPMFADNAASAALEANLIGFSGDIYGGSISIAFSRRLRGLVRFSTRDELVRTVLDDIDSVKRELGEDGVVLDDLGGR